MPGRRTGATEAQRHGGRTEIFFGLFLVFEYVVRLFVGVISCGGEVGGEEVGGFGEGVEEGYGVVGLFEVGGHFFGELLPEGGAGFFVDGGVADDGEGLGFGGDEEEDGVAVFGFVHAELGEVFLGGGKGVGGGFGGDEDAELAGGFLLGGLNGGDEFLFVELGDEGFVMHYQLPPAPPPPVSPPPPLNPPPPPLSLLLLQSLLPPPPMKTPLEGEELIQPRFVP